MTTTMTMPSFGHLKMLYHLFSFLKNKHNSELVLDQSVPEYNVDGLCHEKGLIPHLVLGNKYYQMICHYLLDLVL